MSAALDTTHIVFDIACPECGCTTEGIWTSTPATMRTDGEGNVVCSIGSRLEVFGCTVCDWLMGVADE